MEQRWRISRERKLAKRTVKLYQKHLDYLTAWLGDRPIEELDEDGFFAYLAEAHPEWSDSTCHSSLCAAKDYLRWAGHEQHPLFKAAIKRREPGPQRTITADELASLYDALGTSRLDIRDRALLHIGAHCGLRAAELCRLKIEDVDLERGRLHVRQKGGSIRWATLPRFILDDLHQWLDIHPGGEAFLVSVGGLKPGHPLTPGGLKSVCRRMAERAGIDSFTPHALRRGFATMYAERNVSLRVIMAQGGWRNLAMVVRYTKQLGPEAMRDHFHDFSVNGRNE